MSEISLSCKMKNERNLNEIKKARARFLLEIIKINVIKNFKFSSADGMCLTDSG